METDKMSGKVRALTNAELVATSSNGSERTVQFGSGTYFEVNHILTYKQDGEKLADITLKDGSVIEGVVWNNAVFENHGAVEEDISTKKSNVKEVEKKKEELKATNPLFAIEENKKNEPAKPVESKPVENIKKPDAGPTGNL